MVALHGRGLCLLHGVVARLGDIQSMDQPGQDDGPYATLVAKQRRTSATGPLPSKKASGHDCSANGTVVDDIGGRELVDGRTYLVAVTVHDVWLNVDLSLGRPRSSTTPFHSETLWTKACRQHNRSGQKPDHPQDDGSAIDVVFAPSAVDDFGHYLVWTFTESITNVSAWHADGMLSDGVSALRIDTQRIDADGSSFEITMNEAMQRNKTAPGPWCPSETA